MNPCRGKGGQTPEHRAKDDERLARVPIAEPARERRNEHVGDEERGGKRPHLLIGRMKFALDERNFTGKNVAINIVQQIQRQKQQKRAQGGMDRGASRWG